MPENILYLIGGITVLGISFFLMMRSVDKNLSTLKVKSKKKK
jgi:hypothetical protein